MTSKHFLATVSAAALACGLGLGVAQAEPTQWTGVYGGVHVGYGGGDPTLTTNSAVSSSAVMPFDSNWSGGVVGAHLGYNFQFDQVVAGIEGDFDWLAGWDTKGVGTDTSDNFESDMNYLATIRARLGYAVGDRALVYITGGAAFTDAEAKFHAGTAAVEKVKHHFGGVAGLGFEHKVAENVSLRAEGLYYFFGKEDYDCKTSCTTGKVGDIDLDAYTLRIGISYHF